MSLRVWMPGDPGSDFERELRARLPPEVELVLGSDAPVPPDHEVRITQFGQSLGDRPGRFRLFGDGREHLVDNDGVCREVIEAVAEVEAEYFSAIGYDIVRHLDRRESMLHMRR